MLPLWRSFGAFFTLWQSLSQVWFSQAKLLPHFLPQGADFAMAQGQSEVSCPPRQVTGTGCWHSGHSKFFTKVVFWWNSKKKELNEWNNFYFCSMLINNLNDVWWKFSIHTWKAPQRSAYQSRNLSQELSNKLCQMKTLCSAGFSNSWFPFP